MKEKETEATFTAIKDIIRLFCEEAGCDTKMTVYTKKEKCNVGSYDLLNGINKLERFDSNIKLFDIDTNDSKLILFCDIRLIADEGGQIVYETEEDYFENANNMTSDPGNERLTWKEIGERYPNQFIGLTNVELDEANNVVSGEVSYVGYTFNELKEIMLETNRRVFIVYQEV